MTELGDPGAAGPCHHFPRAEGIRVRDKRVGRSVRERTMRTLLAEHSVRLSSRVRRWLGVLQPPEGCGPGSRVDVTSDADNCGNTDPNRCGECSTLAAQTSHVSAAPAVVRRVFGAATRTTLGAEDDE